MNSIPDLAHFYANNIESMDQITNCTSLIGDVIWPLFEGRISFRLQSLQSLQSLPVIKTINSISEQGI